MNVKHHYDQLEFDGCPFCDCAEFLEGPHGAEAVNFKCKNCGATFNDMHRHGVQLIGWPEKSPLELYHRSTLDEIRELVCRYYKIEPAMLQFKSRKQAYATPRNIYVYLCRRHTHETIQAIARTINRSHSTVLYASEIVKHKMKTDQKLYNQIDFLSQRLEMN